MTNLTPPPPQSLATGLSTKEISDDGAEKEDSNEGAEKEDSDEGEREDSDEGAEKEDSDEGAVREDSDEGTKKILMKEQTQARSREGEGGASGGHLIPPHPTPPPQMAKSNVMQDNPRVIIKE